MSDEHQFHLNYAEGLNKFQGARQRAFWQEMLSHLRGKPAELFSFDDVKHRLRLREESYQGLQDVPLDQIVGSVGRYREFTRNFLPKTNISRERWSRVYAQANSMTGLPPIELYKVGNLYFVRDGNHRVSVAQQLGSKTIEAHVTELSTEVPLHPRMSNEDLDDATAYANFLEETGLTRNRHHHQPLNLSERSRYADLMGHIYLHKSILEKMADREVDLEEAAIHWYDTVYRPGVTLIRKYDMVEQLDARTEADLYLWLTDHLMELRDQYGDEAPSRKISQALVDFLEDRKLEVPQQLTFEDDDSMILSQTQMMRAIRQMQESRESSEEVGDSQPYENGNLTTSDDQSE